MKGEPVIDQLLTLGACPPPPTPICPIWTPPPQITLPDPPPHHHKYETKKMGQPEPTAACSCAPRHRRGSAAGRCISSSHSSPA